MKTNHKNRWLFLFVLLVFATVVLVFRSSGTSAVKEGKKVFIVDQTGERWDITQAVSIGFDPRYFEFGIGRNAFNPLDESNWKTAPEDNYSQMRVIGVAGNGDAHAYSVAKLGSHETANTFLGTQPVVAGY